MSSFLSELGGITAGVGSEGLAFAAGFAASHALEPEAVTIRQDAWDNARVLRIPPEVAAAIAAENIAALIDMENEAHYSGWDDSRFAYLYHLNLVAPGTGELLNMLRRGTISSGNFTHGLRKNKYEPMWDAAITELQTVRLSPAELALGIVRSTVADPGLLVVTLDTAGSTIPKYPVWPGDTLKEAAAGGIDADRLRAMVGAVGLPMSPQQAASATFRKIINRAAFNLSILEGDIRPEYADAIFEQARQIPTADQFVEGWLRGWLSQAEAEAGAAMHGMTPANTDLIYKIKGRPVTFHEITTGLARGGTYPSTYADIPEPYRKSIQEADIRPEWASIHYANRYTYPSAFVLRTLAQAGELGNEAAVEQILLEIGWKPSFAKLVAASWTAGAAAADKNVTSAETHLKTATHKSYIAYEISDQTATTALEAAGVHAASVPAILALWQEERDLIRKSLTAANIKKAVTDAVTNPATGAAWTHADAMAALLQLGYSNDSATTYLEL